MKKTIAIIALLFSTQAKAECNIYLAPQVVQNCQSQEAFEQRQNQEREDNMRRIGNSTPRDDRDYSR